MLQENFEPVTGALPDSPVTDVRCRVFRAKTGDGTAMSFAPLTHRVMVLLEVELADGSVGRGESWANYPAWGWRERIVTVREGIAPLLRGRRFTSPVEVHRLLSASLHGVARQWGAMGPVHQATSGVDIAVWDIAARHAGASLSDLLGGPIRRELPVYASSLGPDNVASSARRCLDRGIAAAKVKVGFGVERDLRNVRTARQVLGDQACLFADANQAWTLDEALEVVPRLRDLGVGWVEEPIAGDAVEQLDILHARTGMPLATGENLYGARSFEPYLGSDGVGIVQPDVSKLGGVTEYLAVSRRAALIGKVVNPHLYNGAVAVLATIQVASASAATGLIEWDVRDNPFTAPVQQLLTEQGTVRVPDAEGLGLDVDLRDLETLEELG